jgi:NAD(P)-dependent dehydrogenase (short-subunit alcohol dehydrogenase family)
VLVVGAGTRPSPEPDPPIGNGRAISVLAAREGAAVACADRDAGAAESTAALVRDEGQIAAVVHEPEPIQTIGTLCMDRVAVLWKVPMAHKLRYMKEFVPGHYPGDGCRRRAVRQTVGAVPGERSGLADAPVRGSGLPSPHVIASPNFR